MGKKPYWTPADNNMHLTLSKKLANTFIRIKL